MLNVNSSIDIIVNNAQRSPFLEKLFTRHPYKEYRDDKNRLILEWKDIRLVQVLRNNEDRQRYTEIMHDYVDYAMNNFEIDENDKNGVFKYDEVFEFETTHKNYNDFPMFFAYSTNDDECLGLCGYRSTEIYNKDGRDYELVEISCRFPKLANQNSIETKRGNIIFMLFNYAECHNQKVSAHMFSKHRDLGFHLTDIIKNFTFVKKQKFNGFFENTYVFAFVNV